MDGWQDARRVGVPTVGAGLGLLELALVRLAGPPGHQLEVLRQLGEVGADPLASLLALAAEGLAAYLLAVLSLRLRATVPGAGGQLAAGAAVLATPAAIRRALDLLLGGALLAQATLTPLPSRRRSPAGGRRPGGPDDRAPPDGRAPPHATAAPGRRPPLPRLRPPPRGRCPPGRAGRQPVRRGRGPGRPCRRGWGSSGPTPT